MNRSVAFLTAFTVGGCAMVQPLSKPAPLILKPQFAQGSLTQTLVPIYSKALIHHLKLKVFSVNAGEHETGAEQTLLNAQLDNTVVFANLKPNTTYRVRAYAYFTTDDTQLISTTDSYVDIVLGADDRPTVQALSVHLIDRSFDGQASAALTVNPGGYSPVASEQMRQLGLEGVVASIAGSGSAGLTDGTGTQAAFNQPCGLTIDSAGNLFVADRNNRRVCKVTPAGVVTTFAGNGTAASVDGTGTLAKICYPHGLTVSATNEVYFAEGWSYSHRIRKISTTGVVMTIAGGTVQGLLDGTGTAARFYNPSGLLFDKSGNLYIGDCSNNCLRKMAPDGVVTTLVGSGIAGNRDGYGTNAQLDLPSMMAFDKYGNLYTNSGSTYPNNCIKKISPTGMVTTLAGLGNGWQDGTGLSAKFGRIEGLVFDASGDLYVADRGNHRIRRVQ